MKDKIIGIRVDEDFLKKLEQLAAKEDRTLSDYIRIQLKKLVEKTK